MSQSKANTSIDELLRNGLGTTIYSHASKKKWDTTLELLEEYCDQQVTKGRADELEKAVQQFIFNTKTNPENFSKYATARLKHLEELLK